MDLERSPAKIENGLQVTCIVLGTINPSRTRAVLRILLISES